MNFFFFICVEIVLHAFINVHVCCHIDIKPLINMDILVQYLSITSANLFHPYARLDSTERCEFTTDFMTEF